MDDDRNNGVTPDEAIDLARHMRASCPFLKFGGLMSMGEIGDVSEYKIMKELK